jgi:hypothetical protein
VLKASALLQQAARYSRTLSARVDIYSGITPLYANVPVVSGSIKGDRDSRTRLNADVILALAPNEGRDINVHKCRFKVHRGIESIGISERMQLGEFRIDELSRDESGLIDINGSGLESYVIDARFIRPRTPPKGTSTIGFIIQLIHEVMPSVPVRILTTNDALITATAPWDSERWDAVEAMAQSIQAEVYANALGEFVIADAPNLLSEVPVYLVNEGEGGVLVTRKNKDTRDQVYNAVSVSGSSTDPNVLPVWAWAYDNDPLSPMYYWADPLLGGFGQVPRFFESQFFTTEAQCQRTADNLLAQSLAANKALTFSTVPLGFLEAGDTVTVQLLDGTYENHLLQSFTCTLDVVGTYDADTLSSKVIARALDTATPIQVVQPPIIEVPSDLVYLAPDPLHPGLFVMSSSGTIAFMAIEDPAHLGTWPVVETASLSADPVHSGLYLVTT